MVNALSSIRIICTKWQQIIGFFVVLFYKLSVGMIIRKIYNRLEAHLLKRQVTVIVGLRRTGESTAMKYLLEKVAHQNQTNA